MKQGDRAQFSYQLPVDPQPTERELEVLRLVAIGNTGIAISLKLGTARQTVKNQVYTVCQKLGARSRAHAVYLAMRKNLIQ